MLPNASSDLRILALCPDWSHPAGGVRKIYRHVDVLTANGLPAMVVHRQPGFRCSWFENKTVLAYEQDVWPPRPADILLVPESIAWQMIGMTPGVRKVAFNQNAYQTFVSATAAELQRLVAPQNHPDYVATLVVSEDSRDYLSHIFPQHPIYRLHNSVDPALFHYQAAKKRQLVFMPRKKKDDAVQVMNILRFRRALDGFDVVAVSNKSESETAQTLRESMVFMSFSTYEGSPMPPMEALACGCVTVGYDGRGGAEYLNEEYGFPVPAEDVLGFARTMEEVLKQLRQNPEPLLAKAKHACDFVLSTYTPDREAQDIVSAWTQILARLPSARTG